MTLLKQIIDEKILRLLQVLYKNKSQFYHLTQLASEAKVPSATTFRLISRLSATNLITTSTVGKLKIYRYNETTDNNKIMELFEI